MTSMTRAQAFRRQVPPVYKRQFPPVCPQDGRKDCKGCFFGCRFNQYDEDRVLVCTHPEAHWPPEKPIVWKPRRIWMQESLFWYQLEGDERC